MMGAAAGTAALATPENGLYVSSAPGIRGGICEPKPGVA